MRRFFSLGSAFLFPLLVLASACSSETPTGTPTGTPTDTAAGTETESATATATGEWTPTLTDGAQSLARWIALDEVADLSEDVQLLDVRTLEEFTAGHIPGALNVPYESLRTEIDGVSGMVVPVADAQTVLRAAGLDPTQPVLVYGGRYGRDAGRVVWTLDLYGHGAEVWVLDGGWSQWDVQELTVETGVSSARSSTWTAGVINDAVNVDADWVEAHLDDESVIVLDVRSPDEYADGHVPGALNVEWTENVHTEGESIGLLRAIDELEALYQGLARDATVVVMCRSGARAGEPYVMLPILDFEDVRLYDGSWNDWTHEGTRPIEM